MCMLILAVDIKVIAVCSPITESIKFVSGTADYCNVNGMYMKFTLTVVLPHL